MEILQSKVGIIVITALIVSCVWLLVIGFVGSYLQGKLKDQIGKTDEIMDEKVAAGDEEIAGTEKALEKLEGDDGVQSEGEVVDDGDVSDEFDSDDSDVE